MQFILIVALVIAIGAVIFAASNTDTASVNFFTWELYNGPYSLSLVIAMLLGVLISILVSTPSWIRNRMAVRNLNKQLTEMQKELNDQNAKLESTQKQLEEKEKEIDLIKNPPPPVQAPPAQADIQGASELVGQPEPDTPPNPD